MLPRSVHFFHVIPRGALLTGFLFVIPREAHSDGLPRDPGTECRIYTLSNVRGNAPRILRKSSKRVRLRMTG